MTKAGRIAPSARILTELGPLTFAFSAVRFASFYELNYAEYEVSRTAHAQ